LAQKKISSLTREDRIALIDWDDPEFSLKFQTELLGLNRTSLYYKPKGPSPKEIQLKHRIDQIYTDYPFYGSRRITALLNQEGFGVNRKTVQRCMREMGLAAIYPGPNLSKRNLQHRVYPYLLKGLPIQSPNYVWGIDITYIRLQRGWMYLVAILDWYSRYVVSWELDQSLEIDFVLQAVKRALAQSKPIILNSDQGSHFTSQLYIDLLKDAGIKISMDSKGRALDNIFTERLWRSLKYEEVYLKEYSNPKDARRGIGQYLDFYNHKRLHQSLNYQTPATLFFI
jgi:putative transposase